MDNGTQNNFIPSAMMKINNASKRRITNDDAFFVVKPFMARDLKLSGLSRDVFSIIWGFSISESGFFTAGKKWISDFLYGKSDKNTTSNIRKIISELVKRGYVEEYANVSFHNQICKAYRISQLIIDNYSSVIDNSKKTFKNINFSGDKMTSKEGLNTPPKGGQNNPQGGVKYTPQGGLNTPPLGGQLHPHNINNNININKKDNITCKSNHIPNNNFSSNKVDDESVGFDFESDFEENKKDKNNNSSNVVEKAVNFPSKNLSNANDCDEVDNKNKNTFVNEVSDNLAQEQNNNLQTQASKQADCQTKPLCQEQKPCEQSRQVQTQNTHQTSINNQQQPQSSYQKRQAQSICYDYQNNSQNRQQQVQPSYQKQQPSQKCVQTTQEKKPSQPQQTQRQTSYQKGYFQQKKQRGFSASDLKFEEVNPDLVGAKKYDLNECAARVWEGIYKTSFTDMSNNFSDSYDFYHLINEKKLSPIAIWFTWYIRTNFGAKNDHKYYPKFNVWVNKKDTLWSFDAFYSGVVSIYKPKLKLEDVHDQYSYVHEKFKGFCLDFNLNSEGKIQIVNDYGKELGQFGEKRVCLKVNYKSLASKKEKFYEKNPELCAKMDKESATKEEIDAAIYQWFLNELKENIKTVSDSFKNKAAGKRWNNYY